MKEHQREIRNLRRRAQRRVGREARLNFMAEVIAAYPEHFDMDHIIAGDGMSDKYQYGNTPDAIEGARTVDLLHCGTVGCIAGWAYFLWPTEARTFRDPYALEQGHDGDWVPVGARLLGLTDSEASDLFTATEMDVGDAVAELHDLASR